MGQTFLSVLLLLFTTPLFAATHTWLGAVSNRFSEPLNWASNGVPAPGEEADLDFPTEATRLDVINDIAGLHVKSITSGADVDLSGQPFVMANGSISASNGMLTIWNDIDVEGTLTLTGFRMELKGALSGSGGVTVDGFAFVTFSGTRSNSYRGETVVQNDSRLWLRKENAIAVPGNLRTAGFAPPVIFQEQPEQIADSAVVTLTGGELSLAFDETIDTLRSGRLIAGDSRNLPTLTVGTLAPDDDFHIHANVRLTTSSIPLPATASVEIEGELSVPANAPLQIAGPGRIFFRGSYSVPTRIDGSTAGLQIPNSNVELVSGSFSGKVNSFAAAAGHVQRLEAKGDVRLSPAVTLLAYGQNDIFLNGTLDLGGAALDVDATPGLQSLTIIRNASSQPVIGTFKGIPEGGIALNQYRVTYKGGDGNDVALVDLQKPQAAMSVAADPSPVVIGDLVTFTAALTGSAGMPTGTVTFALENGTELGTATIANGKASLQTRLTSGRVPSVTARYSGDAAYASSSIRETFDVAYAKPVITSIDPASGRAGAKVAVTIRGSGFLAESIVQSNVPVRDTLFVSPSEMRVTLDLTFRRPQTTISVIVVQPDFTTFSNEAQFSIIGDPPAPSAISFDDATNSAVFTTTKGAKTAWIEGTADLDIATAFLIDTDNDGIVRWTWPRGRFPEVMIGAVDLSAGTFAFNGRGSAFAGAAVLDWPKQSFVRDGLGFVRTFVIEGRGPWLVLWARPGVGAWRALVDDGTDADADGVANGITIATTDAFTLLGDSPPQPGSFAKGDIVIAYSRGFVPAPRPIYAGKLGAEIDEVVPGRIAMASLSVFAAEDEGVARIPVIRTGGANGAATVHYRTLDSGAFGGYDFTAVNDGVLTFAPGEVVKFIEIPLRNDDAFTPPRSFSVALFDAGGATLEGIDQTVVFFYDFDRPPELEAVGSTLRIVSAGDAPVPLEIPLRLTGAFTTPITVTWTETTADGNESGSITFQPGESQKTFRVMVPEAARVRAGFTDIQVIFDAREIEAVAYVDIHIETKPNAHVVPLAVSEKAGIAHVVIALDHPFTQRTNVECLTADGSATPRDDYSQNSQTIVFQPGQTQQTFDVALVDDAAIEGDETFEVRAFFPNGEIAHGLVVIVDDEVTARPRLSIDDHLSINEGNGLSSGDVTLRLSEASTLPVSVLVETSDGTAAGGFDYDQKYEVVTFAPGETAKTLPLFVYGDTAKEPNETFFVTLSSATNATLDPAASRTTVTIVDEDPALPVRRRAMRH